MRLLHNASGYVEALEPTSLKLTAKSDLFYDFRVLDITCQCSGYHTVITWSSHGSVLSSHGHHMSVYCHHMAITCQCALAYKSEEVY